MDVFVGTSGYSYKEWKGNFYPEDLPAAKMLRFYSERFSTVEINNTFYRMPDKKLMSQWSAQVPSTFRFVLKAPQRITHRKKLAEAAEDTAFLFDVASVLGESLGPVLFQLPPYFRKDVERLKEFLALVPAERQAAFEFRHESWFDEAVFSALRDHRAALCVAETDETSDLRLERTTSWGYLRLRRTDYDEVALKRWAERLNAQPWREAYVFFKHEEEGKGPRFAQQFMSYLPA